MVFGDFQLILLGSQYFGPLAISSLNLTFSVTIKSPVITWSVVHSKTVKCYTGNVVDWRGSSSSPESDLSWSAVFSLIVYCITQLGKQVNQ